MLYQAQRVPARRGPLKLLTAVYRVLSRKHSAPIANSSEATFLPCSPRANRADIFMNRWHHIQNEAAKVSGRRYA